VIGEVCGKGAQAAVLTALVRHTLRAEALRTPYPSAVLAAAHEVLAREHPDRFCTALMATLNHTAEGLRLNVASGGHHLPIRVHPDGRIDTLGLSGGIIGMIDTPRLVDTTTMLGAGDVIVFYTDGVTEARSEEGQFFDEDRLYAAILGSIHSGAEAMAAELVATALAFQDGFARDDMAVVVLKVPPGTGVEGNHGVVG
jgi:sigma-B regulation protein RsbU (phosphoserine phosphatase)